MHKSIQQLIIQIYNVLILYSLLAFYFLEHLYYDEAINLLIEIKRILKPGFIFRCTVPDLEIHVDFYNNNLKDDVFDKFTYKAQAFFN